MEVVVCKFRDVQLEDMPHGSLPCGVVTVDDVDIECIGVKEYEASCNRISSVIIKSTKCDSGFNSSVRTL